MVLTSNLVIPISQLIAQALSPPTRKQLQPAIPLHPKQQQAPLLPITQVEPLPNKVVHNNLLKVVSNNNKLLKVANNKLRLLKNW